MIASHFLSFHQKNSKIIFLKISKTFFGKEKEENTNILNQFYFKILYRIKKDAKKIIMPIINENSIN